jgi:inorganic pyrophosphatase|tara:strand:+ start:315 stop:458 length:144 start_codon:yes stop_codon:yes gene_type:complete
MAFKMKSPLKTVEDLEDVVEQLKGAVKAHTAQYKTIQKHINLMKKAK